MNIQDSWIQNQHISTLAYYFDYSHFCFAFHGVSIENSLLPLSLGYIILYFNITTTLQESWLPILDIGKMTLWLKDEKKFEKLYKIWAPAKSDLFLSKLVLFKKILIVSIELTCS